MDPPIDDHYITDDADKRPVTLDLRPFLGTYEDFVDPTSSNSYYDGERPASRSMQGMFDDIQHYWAHERPKSFDTSNPSIHALAYYMLSIVAAEWVKYVAVMQSCLKQYEYNHDQLPALSLDKFDKDLRELQSWRRRTMISQGKIKAVLRFLSSGHGCSAADIKLLSEDFEYLDGNIENVGRRLENMLPVVMSFVQITDARRSFAETANITRLTVLALIFVPLTFVSSLFSMNNSLDTLRQTIWMYFAIAVPLTTVVAVIAKPPLALRKWVGTIWIRSILKRKGNTRMSLKRMWRSETSGRELERLQASRNLEA